MPPQFTKFLIYATFFLLGNTFSFALNSSVTSVDVTLSWQQTMPESFTFAASAAGERILVRCGEYPGKNYLALFDQTGKELWRVGPLAGKELHGPNISADGKLAAYVETWPIDPKIDNGPVMSKVILLNANTGKPIQGKDFPEEGDWINIQMSADGKFLLCNNMSMEQGGSFARLYQIDTPTIKELWRLESVTPSLYTPSTDAKGKTLNALPSFSDAQLLPGQGDTILVGGHTIIQIDQQGHRHWVLDTGKNPGSFAGVSPAGDLLGIFTDEYNEEWPWVFRRPGAEEGYTVSSELSVKRIRLGVYLFGDWYNQPDPSAVRLLAGLLWPEGLLMNEASTDFAGIALTTDGDVAVAAVFSSTGSMLYRIPLFPFENNAPAAQSKVLGIKDNQVWTALSPTGLLAVSSTGENIDRYHSRARFTLYDIFGNKLWEDASREGGHQEISLSTDGTLLYASTGQTLYCYKIKKK